MKNKTIKKLCPADLFQVELNNDNLPLNSKLNSTIGFYPFERTLKAL